MSPPSDNDAMLITSPQDPERLRELASRIGERLSTRTDEISESMSAAIEGAVGELDDDDARASLHASVRNNVEVIVHLLARSQAPHDLPPVPEAVRYAVELARTEVPSASLRRAYHVGSDNLLAHIFDGVREIDCESHEQLPLFHHLAGWLYQYVDEITRTVMSAYDDEVQSSRSRAARSVNTVVNGALSGEFTGLATFASTTGYRLDQLHLGARVWIDDYGSARDQERVLTSVVSHLTEELHVGSTPLTVFTDRATAEVWFGWARRRPPLHTSSIAPVVTSVPRARIAFGAPAAGIDGFRTTRAQAARAATIARVSTAPAAHVVSYADDGIPIVARLAEDLPATRRWVGEVLGPLARDTADAARQRETIRVFLESAENYSDTAARLLLHRNTVKYRLTKAEDELGRAPGERRMDTQLALTTCHLLGGAVLTPTTATGAGA